ncbi:hypothetical protein GCM10029963_34510 [Micromonospora andamanensis]
MGRAEQLDRLQVAVAGVHGRGILFTGSAGIGKSRLLHEGVDTLPGEKYAVWRIAASATTSAMAFGGLVQVLPEQPQGLSPAGILRWAVDVLQQQAAGRRIVLAVDDAHLLDPPSAALVHLVARAENASVVGTLRDGEQIPLPIRALWTDGLVERAELGPMTPDETAAMLTAIVGGQVDSGSTDRLGRLSAGNPLLLRELVHAATNSGELVEKYGVWTWTGRLELAPSLTELIDIRIGQLTPGYGRWSSLSRSASHSACGCCTRPWNSTTWSTPRNADSSPWSSPTGDSTSGWRTRSTARWCAGSAR